MFVGCFLFGFLLLFWGLLGLGDFCLFWLVGVFLWVFFCLFGEGLCRFFWLVFFVFLFVSLFACFWLLLLRVFLVGLVILSPSGLRNNSPSWKGQVTKVTTFDMTSVFCVICRMSNYTLCDI